VAARLRRELHVEVEMVRGHSGEFKVLWTARPFVDGGATAFLGVMPSGRKIVEIVRNSLKQ
jgi:hypothetical protein